jgi:hypothetical protein
MVTGQARPLGAFTAPSQLTRATWTPPRPFPLLAPSTFFLTLFPLLQFASWFPSPAPIGTTSDARFLTTSSRVYNPMAACNPTPTLTLFRTVTSTTIITTSTVVPQTQPDGECSSNSVSAPLFSQSFPLYSRVAFSKTCGIDTFTGSVSTVTLPLIVTSLFTLVTPSSTLYASCLSSSTPTSTTTQSTSPQPSPTVTTITITTTPLPVAVTTLQTSTLDNGETTVFTITSTSTPPVSTITSTPALPSQTSKSSSNIAPIIGGAAGGFIFLIGVVALTWFIWCVCVTRSWKKSLTYILSRKKCGKSSAVREEEDVVFPYPVTRDRDQGRRLDLTKETRPYEHDRRSTQIGAPGRLPAQSHDGRPDSSAPLIGTSGVGLTPMASASGPLATVYGAQNSERRASETSHRLPPGAAPGAVPRDHYSHSGGSVSASSSVGPTSPNRRPLHVINSPPSPMPILPGPSSGAVPGSSSTPLGYEPEQQSAWPEKTHARGTSSSSGVILSNDGQFQGRDPRASVSAPVEPNPTTGEPTDAPPAYVA